MDLHPSEASDRLGNRHEDLSVENKVVRNQKDHLSQEVLCRRVASNPMALMVLGEDEKGEVRL